VRYYWYASLIIPKYVYRCVHLLLPACLGHGFSVVLNIFWEWDEWDSQWFAPFQQQQWNPTMWFAHFYNVFPVMDSHDSHGNCGVTCDSHWFSIVTVSQFEYVWIYRTDTSQISNTNHLETNETIHPKLSHEPKNWIHRWCLDSIWGCPSNNMFMWLLLSNLSKMDG